MRVSPRGGSRVRIPPRGGSRVRIPLDGDAWVVKPYLGEEWRFRRAYADDTGDVHGWVSARVPGSVVDDLVRAGEITDPRIDRASLAAEWVAERTWVYRREVVLPPETDGRRVVVHFEGIDHAAEIFWNGTLVGVHEGMFVPAELEVTSLAAAGRNVVAVVVVPAPPSEPQVGRTERVRNAKSRMTYGWDFCPRLVHLGVWDHAWVDVTDGVRISDIAVRPRLAEDLGRARVDWEVTVESPEVPPGVSPGGVPPGEAPPGDVIAGDVRAGQSPAGASPAGEVGAPVVVDAAVVLDGETVATATVTRSTSPAGAGVSPGTPSAPDGRAEAAATSRAVSARRMSGAFDLDRPQLWWPNGHGAQRRYVLRVQARAQGGGSDAREVTFGLRRVDMVHNAGAPGGARPYTVVVNGRRIYVTGWNWVPLDIHHGVQDADRLEHLVALAADAHVTMLRVWGGGLLETDAFYDACDRHGIMVWQEFPLSSSGISSVPSRDPAYVALMQATAERMVPRRVHHPSLVLWCGGNELDDPQGQPLDEQQPVVAALADVVARLDPGRGWLPTSPSGPTATCTLEAVDRDPEGLHDVHGPWEHQGLDAQRTLYDRSTALLHSEFGVEGMTNLPTLEAYVSPGHRWPADRSNPYWVHRGDWWINTPLVQDCFGGRLEDLQTLCRASQFLQAEGLRYAVEANRRRQWRCSGTLPWQFNEPFPTGFCTSAVDYRGRPKPVYHDVAAAYRPLQTSAAFPTLAWPSPQGGGRSSFTAELWVSVGRDDLADELEVAILSPDGQRHHGRAFEAVTPRESSRRVASYTAPLDDVPGAVFWLDVRLAAHPEAGSRYVFSRATDLAPLLTLAPTTLDATTLDATAALDVTVGGGSVHVHNRGDVAALLVTVTDARPVTAPGYLRCRDGHRSLMPDERWTIPVAWTGAPEDDRRIAVAGWNTDAALLEAPADA